MTWFCPFEFVEFTYFFSRYFLGVVLIINRRG
jgi:hypothetical protein